MSASFLPKVKAIICRGLAHPITCSLWWMDGVILITWCGDLNSETWAFLVSVVSVRDFIVNGFHTKTNEGTSYLRPVNICVWHYYLKSYIYEGPPLLVEHNDPRVSRQCGGCPAHSGFFSGIISVVGQGGIMVWDAVLNFWVVCLRLSMFFLPMLGFVPLMDVCVSYMYWVHWDNFISSYMYIFYLSGVNYIY